MFLITRMSERVLNSSHGCNASAVRAERRYKRSTLFKKYTRCLYISSITLYETVFQEDGYLYYSVLLHYTLQCSMYIMRDNYSVTKYGDSISAFKRK